MNAGWGLGAGLGGSTLGVVRGDAGCGVNGGTGYGMLIRMRGAGADAGCGHRRDAGPRDA